MRVVVIGSGAREHALVRGLVRAGLAQGDSREVICLPGNAGIAGEVRCVLPASSSARDLAAAALAEKPDLIVVGPEGPLAEGLSDLFAEARVPCLGPSKAAAQIESSKAFAKEIMAAAQVPHAEARVFADSGKARAFARTRGACVVKLDGLAAGKGVVVCDDSAQAELAVLELWRPGARLLIEERFEGPEVSIIALCDGESLLALPPARDHKRLLDGDRGPNTGGMGAVSPPADTTQALVDEAMRTVLEPTARALRERGMPFVGALYAGLMLTPHGIRVLEFNCRLGDPEAQAILLRLRSDPLPLFLATAQGRLSSQKPAWDSRTSVAVVLAAHGYPAAPRTGDVIDGLDALAVDEGSDDLWILHAGTRAQKGQTVTAGGRVLTVAALGAHPAQARARAYAAASRISFAGSQLRSDIAAAES